MKLTINLGSLIGWPIIIYQAFKLWGSSGTWLAVGSLLCASSMNLTWTRGA